MALAHTVVLALHVLFAAAWFGLGLALPALSKSAVAGGGAEAGRRVITSMNGSIALFYVFALANWILGRRIGFEAQYNEWPYHVSLTLGLVLVLVQFLVIRPGWNTLATDPEAGRKKIAMGTGIGHAVWLATFILMYVGRGVVGA